MTTPPIHTPRTQGVEEPNSTLAGCRIVPLPRVPDVRGNLSFVEEKRHVPFAIRRVYWVYDVPGGATRDGHAYHTLEEFIIAVSGSFDVVIDDGKKEQVVQLNRSYVGLYVPPMVWRRLENFSSNSVALILASQPFSEADYLREYQDFTRLGKTR
jgi:mannose-6-phosphate isomerase-like protein (cupin superfamily)